MPPTPSDSKVVHIWRTTIHSIWKTRTGNEKRKSGQTIIFLVMVLVILFFVILWNFDLHKILHVKAKSQNGGDAAALVAARWQGITLNIIGDLNLMRAMAITVDNAPAVSSISNIQARLCFVGPMISFMAAQQAAKNNGIYPNPAYSDYVAKHADTVRNDYPTISSAGGSMLFPEPYTGCWTEYADMLDLIASEGIAAGADNMSLYTDYSGDHYLLLTGFYDAIAGKSWCWFYRNGAPTLLDEYQNFFPAWWDNLPDMANKQYINSEFFGLGLVTHTTRLDSFMELAAAITLASERSMSGVISNQALATLSTWFCYSEDIWSTWDAMSTSGPYPFPATGPVKPQYDYAGADAAIRVEATADLLTPEHGGSMRSKKLLWTAAAKPFGFLNGNERPNAYGIVLPAFHDVRLIPVDASSAPSGGAFNLEWREHIEDHLPQYMNMGPAYLANDPDAQTCWYCQQLLQWEDPLFRTTGVAWLAINSSQCSIVPGGPGSHKGGGRRLGH